MRIKVLGLEHLEREMHELLLRKIEGTAGSMTCPVHGSRPRQVTASSRQRGQLVLEAETCCEEFRESVVAELERVLKPPG